MHRAIEFTAGGTRECRVCGRAVLGHGATLRHFDEAVPVLAPEPEDARAMERAREAVAAELRTLPADATPQDVAVAAMNALYRDGWLRRVRGPRRGKLVADGEREPDHAERAAGALVRSA